MTDIPTQRTDVPLFLGDVLADFRLTERCASPPRDKAWSAWHATDLMFGRRVVLKVMHRDAARLDSCRTLEEELARGVWVPHPGLVRLYGVREDNDWITIAEALVEDHRNILKYISHDLEGHNRERRLASLFAKTAEALDVAHGVGIAHGALSPGNLLVTVDGLPKVSDLGLHSLVTPDRCLAGVASSPYASPEQFLGLQQGEWVVDPAVDQFSLAVLLHEAYAGRHPYAPEHGPARASDALVRRREAFAEPTPLDAVCQRALEPDPRDRYPTMAAFADDLLAAVEGSKLMTRRPGVVGQLRRMARRWMHQLPSSPAEASVSLVRDQT